MKKIIWFNAGLFVGVVIFSLARASVPTKSKTVDDTVVEQQIAELNQNVKKEAKADFEREIKQLALLEKSPKYKESLPIHKSGRFKGAMGRIENQKYRYSALKGNETFE
jgi:hypothetical protein